MGTNLSGFVILSRIKIEKGEKEKGFGSNCNFSLTAVILSFLFEIYLSEGWVRNASF